ncbi:metallophosphoesterase [Arcticibacter tournemirensis]
MRSSSSRWIISMLLLLADWYIFGALRFIFSNIPESLRATVYLIYWLLTALSISALVLFPYIQSLSTLKKFRNDLFTLLTGLQLSKIAALAVFFIDDFRRLLIWLARALQNGGTAGIEVNRSVLLTSMGFCIGGGLFLALLWGYTNKYRYRVRHIKLKFASLPSGFRGMKFIQISDIHSGSLQNKKSVNKGIDLILKEKPEMVLFTGDLVNDRAVEMDEYMDVFSRIKAPLGVYSILGNHDYGDYYWGTYPQGQAVIDKKENLHRLKQIHKELGWRLLMNEHVAIKRNGDEIALLGIENWGAKAGFPKYGQMNKAYPGSEKYPFKILMSHDPSHWKAEVKVKYPDINLTLSGHTHGMQFGIELGGIKWSPVQWVYKEWAGLYGSGDHKLYVNQGFGFLGYPGRVGIFPEITVFEFV